MWSRDQRTRRQQQFIALSSRIVNPRNSNLKHRTKASPVHVAITEHRLRSIVITTRIGRNLGLSSWSTWTLQPPSITIFLSQSMQTRRRHTPKRPWIPNIIMPRLNRGRKEEGTNVQDKKFSHLENVRILRKQLMGNATVSRPIRSSTRTTVQHTKELKRTSPQPSVANAYDARVFAKTLQPSALVGNCSSDPGKHCMTNRYR
eukprot:m.150008 g.150008  ORF g.150008 m.150008 type:complete len:203 (+) comp14261_c0_seq1:2784-3392(+)